MYAEATFEEKSTRFNHIVLAVAGKLEKAGFALAFRSVRWEKEELEYEVLASQSPDFEIPASILDEFTERLEKNLFFLEPMKERIQKLIKF